MSLSEILESAILESGVLSKEDSLLTFPWEIFSRELAKTFDQKEASVSLQTVRTLDDPTDGMGKNPHIQTFSLSPIPGPLFLILPEKGKLAGHLLGNIPSDPTIAEGFQTFAILNALETFNRISPFGPVLAQLAQEKPLPTEKTTCIDVILRFEGHSFPVRIVASEETIFEIQSTSTKERPSLLENPEFSKLSLPLSLSVGSTSLKKEEFDQAKVGDLLVLDRCTYDPATGKGTGILSLQNQALFDVRIKEEECKILESTSLSSPETEDLLLTAEIATFTMPAAAISQLRASCPIDLPPLTSRVTLLHNGKPLAAGELLRIGEVPGVKILKLGE